MLFKKTETHFVPNFSENRAIDEIITINATEPQKPKKNNGALSVIWCHMDSIACRVNKGTKCNRRD